ncbi:MAG: tetratricopeptide repeat protein [Paraglaciecola sp.]|uniref:5'-methylthioadenosine/S-adenosylhomocysteine nucleosidase family protein n=1 Tax=Paraglaciecola sp. TaxID=1920173 RepID=UPI00329A42BC
MDGKLQCDIALVVALEEELEEILPNLGYKPHWDEEKEEYYYEFEMGLGSRSYQCIAVLIGGMGPEKAAISCERLISKFKPETLVNIGISGGLSNDVNICDVVIGSQIDGYHQDSKIVENKRGDISLSVSKEAFPTSKAIQKHAKNFKLAHTLAMESWQAESKSRWEKQCTESNRVFLKTRGIEVTNTKVHVGHIASGPSVIASDKFVKYLKKLDRKYLVTEMESYGVMQSVFENVPSNLIIRGVSDFCDERKKELDELGDGSIRKIAMQNSYSFLCALADQNLFKFSKYSPKRVKFKLTLEASYSEDTGQIPKILEELFKINLDDRSIQVEEISDGSIVLECSGPEAVSDRLESLIGLNAITSVSGFPIKAFSSDTENVNSKALDEGMNVLYETGFGADRKVLFNKAIYYLNKSEFEVSLVLLEKLLYLQNKDGSLELDGIDTLTNLSHVYRRLNDFAEAKRLIDIAIDQYKMMGETRGYRSKILIAKNNRAELLIALKRPTEALLETQEVLRQQLQYLSETHLHVVRTKNNLAEALRHLGYMERALNLHYENLKVRIKASGEKDSDSCISAWNLLLCYADLGMVSEVNGLVDHLKWLVRAEQSTLTMDQKFVREKIRTYINTKDVDDGNFDDFFDL